MRIKHNLNWLKYTCHHNLFRPSKTGVALNMSNIWSPVHSFLESLRLKKTFNNKRLSSLTINPALNHVPKHYAYISLKYLQAWWLHHPVPQSPCSEGPRTGHRFEVWPHQCHVPCAVPWPRRGGWWLLCADTAQPVLRNLPHTCLQLALTLLSPLGL